MNIRLILTVTTFSLILGGCSVASQLLGTSKSRPTPLKPLKAVAPPIIKIKKVWDVKTGSAMGHNKIHPYIDASCVYIAGNTVASAWQKNNGKLKWKTNIGETITAGINGSSAKSIASQHVFIGTNNGNAISLNAKTGKVQWIERLSSEVLSISPSKNGRVTFRTVDGKLHGLSSSTGELIWQHTQASPTLTLHGASVPILIGALVVAGFDNGKIAAYRLHNGQKAWEVTVAKARGNTDLERIIDIDGKIMSLGNALFAASLNGSLTGINLAEGAKAWTRSFSSATGVNVNPEALYSSDNKGNIWRINPQTGNPVWKMDDLQRYHPTLPALASKSLLVIGDKKGNIHWVNSKTGLFVARSKGDPAGYSVEPEVNGNTLYTLGRSGILSKLAW